MIKVAACGICRTDLHVIEADLEPRRNGVIPGHQIVGRVVVAGPNVTGVRVGDRVGVAWLHKACGGCRFCTGGRENLCDLPAIAVPMGEQPASSTSPGARQTRVKASRPGTSRL